MMPYIIIIYSIFSKLCEAFVGPDFVGSAKLRICTGLLRATKSWMNLEVIPLLLAIPQEAKLLFCLVWPLRRKRINV